MEQIPEKLVTIIQSNQKKTGEGEGKLKKPKLTGNNNILLSAYTITSPPKEPPIYVENHEHEEDETYDSTLRDNQGLMFNTFYQFDAEIDVNNEELGAYGYEIAGTTSSKDEISGQQPWDTPLDDTVAPILSVTPNVESLNEYLNSSDINDPFSCPVPNCRTKTCGLDVKHLVKHVNIAHHLYSPERKLLQEKCATTFYNGTLFYNRTMDEKKQCKLHPLFCGYMIKQIKCAFLATDSSELSCHILSHIDEVLEPFCSKCNIIFLTFTLLKEHAQSTHIDYAVNFDDQPYIEASTSDMDVLQPDSKNTILIEPTSLDKSYYSNGCYHTCFACGFHGENGIKSFLSHMLTHTNLKPYRCERCNNSYKSFRRLNAHKCDLLKINQLAPYPKKIKKYIPHAHFCENCQAGFTKKSSLNYHLLHNCKSLKT